MSMTEPLAESWRNSRLCDRCVAEVEVFSEPATTCGVCDRCGTAQTMLSCVDPTLPEHEELGGRLIGEGAGLLAHVSALLDAGKLDTERARYLFNLAAEMIRGGTVLICELPNPGSDDALPSGRFRNPTGARA